MDKIRLIKVGNHTDVKIPPIATKEFFMGGELNVNGSFEDGILNLPTARFNESTGVLSI